jgi:hypothetical protein
MRARWASVRLSLSITLLFTCSFPANIGYARAAGSGPNKQSQPGQSQMESLKPEYEAQLQLPAAIREKIAPDLASYVLANATEDAPPSLASANDRISAIVQTVGRPSDELVQFAANSIDAGRRRAKRRPGALHEDSRLSMALLANLPQPRFASLARGLTFCTSRPIDPHTRRPQRPPSPKLRERRTPDISILTRTAAE